MNKDANMDAKRGKMWENGDRTTLTHWVSSSYSNGDGVRPH